MKKKTLVLAASIVLAGTEISSFASETSPAAMEKTNPSENSKVLSFYDQGMAASRAGNFPEAIKLFERALKQSPKNADVLNMLAHSQRKAGKIDEAIANYKKALELRPDFPEAREYLGEAYLEAALGQIEGLKKSGDAAKEQLEDLTKDFKDAAQKL